MNDVDAAVALERGLLDPACRVDADRVAALLADDFVEIGKSGRIWNRDDVVAALAAEPAGEVAAVVRVDRPVTQADVKASLCAAGVTSGSTMMAHCSLSALGLVVGTLPYVSRRVQFDVLVLLAVLLSLFIGMIRDLGRPYDGLISVEATDMTRVAGDLAEDWAESHPGIPPPCDDRGVSTDAP